MTCGHGNTVAADSMNVFGMGMPGRGLGIMQVAPWISVFFGFSCVDRDHRHLSQVVPLMSGGGSDRPRREASGGTPAKPAFVCPPDYVPSAPQGWRPLDRRAAAPSAFGRKLGPVGVLISTLSGFAMIFSFSGLWLYIQMWRNRKNARSSPAGSGSNPPQRKGASSPYDVERTLRSPGDLPHQAGRVAPEAGSRIPVFLKRRIAPPP
jgi:hypothetical protein